MKPSHKLRRVLTALVIVAGIAASMLLQPTLHQATTPPATPVVTAVGDAATILAELEVKGRAPKTGYDRSLFGDGWDTKESCDMRNTILRRDLTATTLNEKCQVVRGTLADPYTGKIVAFERGAVTSSDVQIDHVVALSDAWQKGAQQLAPSKRVAFANDPLELLAVEGTVNQQKSDGDAATWLPPNKAFRCQYVARQIAVKKKYDLWVTISEKKAMVNVLATCPGQILPQ